MMGASTTWKSQAGPLALALVILALGCAGWYELRAVQADEAQLYRKGPEELVVTHDWEEGKITAVWEWTRTDALHSELFQTDEAIWIARATLTNNDARPLEFSRLELWLMGEQGIRLTMEIADLSEESDESGMVTVGPAESTIIHFQGHAHPRLIEGLEYFQSKLIYRFEGRDKVKSALVGETVAP